MQNEKSYVETERMREQSELRRKEEKNSKLCGYFRQSESVYKI